MSVLADLLASPPPMTWALATWWHVPWWRGIAPAGVHTAIWGPGS